MTTGEQWIDQGYRRYEGEQIDVFFSTDVCQHAANCVKGNPNVFDTKRKPWILADAAEADELARVIETCPSGALQYIRKGDV